MRLGTWSRAYYFQCSTGLEAFCVVMAWTNSAGNVEAITIPPGGTIGPGVVVGSGPFDGLAVVPGLAVLSIGAGVAKQPIN